MTGTVRVLRLMVAAAMTTTLTIGATAAVIAQDDEAILEELVAHETVNLDAWYGAADPGPYIAEVGDGATAYDAFIPMTLMVGDGVKESYSALEGMIPHIEYQIVDPAVDVRGDIVIFTFFIEGAVVDNPDAPYGPWNVTKVMNRTADGWEMIHTHFSSPLPPPAPPEEAPAE